MSKYVPDEATAREDLCRFLSACFYEPAPAFAEEDLFNSMLIAATRLDPELADLARQLGLAFAAQDLQTLLIDYTRLFMGPIEARAKPYGSSWQSTAVSKDSNPSLAVLDLYSEGGFEVDEDFQELPDHVAVELEFLYLLNFKLNQARAGGQGDNVSAIELLTQRFLDEHLGAWIRPFAAAVKAGAETSFYRTLAEFTEHFVRLQATSVAAH